MSAAAYDAGHIDGAVLWNVYSDLKDSRYQLARKAAVEYLLARSGISPESIVVLYGYAPAMGLWLLKLYGHADVRILDCARGTWQGEDRPWTSAAASLVATRTSLPAQDQRIRAGDCKWKMRSATRRAPSWTCARKPSTTASVSGHPAASNPAAVPVTFPRPCICPIESVLDERGSFQAAPDLRQLFSPPAYRATAH